MTCERILLASVNAIRKGTKAPHCNSAWVQGLGYVNDGSAQYDRADYLRQMARDAQSEVENMGFAPAYAEGQGMAYQPKRGVLMANWNNLPTKTTDLLEKAGYAIEWSDEWTTCDGCNKALRTSPNSYWWRPAYVQTESEVFCRECQSDYDYYDGESGEHLVTMPEEAAADCSRPGQDAKDAVSHWLPKVTWVASDDVLRASLKGFGAWEDLETADMDTIKERVLWCGACEWRDERGR